MSAVTILCGLPPLPGDPSVHVDPVATPALVYVPGMRSVAAGMGALAGLTKWPPWYLALALTVLAWGAWPGRPRRPGRLRALAG